MRPEQALRNQVLAFLDRGDIRRAGPTAERLIAQYPDYAPGRAAFSEVWLRCGRADRARDEAAHACRLAPESATMASQYAKCLVFSGDEREALETVEQALKLAPEDHVTLDTIGNVFSRIGEHERALETFRDAHRLAPDNTTAMYNLATSLRFFGRSEEAESLFDRVLERDPNDYQALHSRSLLRRQSESNNHIRELEGRLEAGPPWYAAGHIHYALGKERDDIGRPGDAFEAYQDGAALMREHLPDRLPEDIDNIEAAVCALTDGSLERLGAAGHDSDEPIFVIGLPRTGSTLVERILAAHPDVFAAGELHNFRYQAQRHLQATNPARALESLADAPGTVDAAALGRAYIDSTRPRTGHTPRFVDKMPRNDLWAGLIHRALPNARLILTRRNPMDTGYALFRTLFHTGHEFSYDLGRIGRYLAAHRRLSDALKTHLPPDRLIEVDYERLVQQPETQARRLLNHCGLEWHREVLAFHEAGGAVATASSHQVRQPFHTTSIGRWRAVAEKLDPLRRTLQERGLDPEDQGATGSR